MYSEEESIMVCILRRALWYVFWGGEYYGMYSEESILVCILRYLCRERSAHAHACVCVCECIGRY